MVEIRFLGFERFLGVREQHDVFVLMVNLKLIFCINYDLWLLNIDAHKYNKPNVIMWKLTIKDVLVQ